MSTHIPVLIVGAGPTGLTMAYELHRHGIPFRLIDKKAEPTQTSNALAIQARTLEMLDTMGIVNEFIELGQKITGVCINDGKQKIAQMSTQYIDSAYPYLLIVPQNITEEILQREIIKTGGRTEYNNELTKIRVASSDHNPIASVEIKNASGVTEIITANWVLACDGAHSQVRDLLNIKFEGNELSQQFLLADINADMIFPRNQVQAFVCQEGLLALFPLPDEKLRIVATVNGKQRKSHESIDLIELQDLVNQRTERQLKVNKINWASNFWVHNKISRNMRTDNVFLLGDASHIHSPAGAQGMNTGMQDAYNLAWKLALVIKHQARPSLLDSYERERYPVAESVLHNTDRMTRVGLIRNKLLHYLRLLAIKTLSRLKFLQRQFVMFLSQLTIRYRNSPIINYQQTISYRCPAPGSNAPDVDYIDERGSPRRLLESLRSPKHHLMLFSGKTQNAASWQRLRTLANLVHQQYPNLVEVIGISTLADSETMREFVDQHCVDNNFYIHNKYSITKPAIYLLRPDNYIAYCSATLETEELHAVLRKYLFAANA